MSAAESTRVPSHADGPAFRPGDVVGERYELLEPIGAGAMGAVYRAHDRLLDAEVAVKLIRVDPERTDRERATRRLLLEARAIARISHPGIVRVFDFGCTDVVPFIVMELLEGETLGSVLARQKRMDAETALRCTLPIADAIAVAHRRGVVHRDIKPDNVFLARDEFGRVQPKLVDFGVARLRERGPALTRPGALMGTPDYMAPEQARAEPDVDQRADVWAFGVVLYELMTGRRPFAQRNTSYLGVLKAIISDAPVPITEYGAGDAALWKIFEQTLAKRRGDRFGSMREMGEALAGWLAERGITEDAYGKSLKTSWLMPESTLPSTKMLGARPSDSGEPPTLRADDEAAAHDTVPPVAVPLPKALPPLPAPLPAVRSRRPPQRMRETLGHTLESASPRRFTALQIALASALAAALATASLGWVAFTYLYTPPSSSPAQR
jgi:eukaryotic-like serine/threonine-protein kinase